MKQPEIKITGWKALALLAAVAIFALYRGQVARTTLPTDGADQLKVHLVSEYLSAGLPALQDAIEANDAAATDTLTRELLSRDRVIFRSIDARGSLSDVVVRVEIQVDGHDPPTGDRIRYFRMHHSPITGWLVDYETFSLSYFLKTF